MRPFVTIKFKKINIIQLYLGKKNIPEKGGIVVCGNHRHVDDQYNALIATKRVVHMLAKDEYFKGKKEWFYRMAGCIPVDRSIHDENC
ncbi:MAG: 1-acyl-sn-glycerol-3-phosphate acyltransferase [Clostridium sp.]|nr:MAG: 1-acyl-sn-glycerol-3-phosphate acyltransferase [Clostridium sp.]